MKRITGLAGIVAALAMSIAAFAQTPSVPAAQVAPTPTLGPSTPIPGVTPSYSGKAPNLRVDPPYWPCEEGQFKGNLNSMIVHGPKQRDYSKTHKNVQCFDMLTEAKDAGFKPAKR